MGAQPFSCPVRLAAECDVSSDLLLCLHDGIFLPTSMKYFLAKLFIIGEGAVGVIVKE